MRSLSGMSHLTALNMNFLVCDNFTDTSMMSVVSALRGATHLVHLSLGLANSHVTDKGVITLARFLSSLTRLKELSIELTRITDGGSCRIADAIAHLTLLTYLKLRFFWSIKITDRTMKAITTTLQSLTALSLLELDFTQ
eukprot:TRINITY_DN22671_c0_g1_i1.p2 TRINITY_DN22671_c0_g1~~TRINITY_DN22671_c0_g1_i1.p2  ORF type:complete len:140 (-),score=15.23 TRINITY_DN22671_c0_g1_i1:86-505(-)